MLKSLLPALLLVFICTTSSAQNLLSYEQKAEMVRMSYGENLTDSMLKNAREYAITNDYDYRIIHKNLIHIKVIFNENLDVQNRIDYSDYLITLWAHDKSSLPKSIITNQKKVLQQLKASGHE